MNKFYATYSSNIFFFFKILKPANLAHVDVHLDQGISKLHFMQKDKTYITSHLPIVLQHPLPNFRQDTQMKIKLADQSSYLICLLKDYTVPQCGITDELYKNKL